MSKSNAIGESPPNFPSADKPPFKRENLGFAIAIFVSLAALGVGMAGLGVQERWWQVELLSDLGKVPSIVLIGFGSVVGFVIMYKIKKRPKNEDVRNQPDMTHSPLQTKNSALNTDESKKEWPVLPRFGKQEWSYYSGYDVGVEPPLPENINAILDEICPFSKNVNVRVKHTHRLVLIPEKLGCKNFKLNKLMDLIEDDRWAGHKHPYGVDYWRNVREEFGEKTISQSYWVLMLTEDVVPGSGNLTHAEQKQLIAKNYPGYSMATVLEAATCAATTFGAARKYICKHSTIHCEETVTQNKSPVAVISYGTFEVTTTSLPTHATFTASALRRFT